MSDLKSRYQALIAASELRADPDQQHAVAALADLAFRLENAPRRGSILWFLPGRKAQPVKGIYLWGGVGRGKSMLMDLAFDTIQVASKRRIHFHEFMIDVH